MADLPQRKSIRLPEYDYSQFGYYFITICAENREMYFENNDIKQVIENTWRELKNKFPHIDLDEYAIMPNHLHGIVVVLGDDNHRRGDPCGRPQYGRPQYGRPQYGRPQYGGQAQGLPLQNPNCHRNKPTLGDIIGAFKSITTNYYINGVKTKNWSKFNQRLWQRNYYEHVIRNDESLNRIRCYIQTNPGNCLPASLLPQAAWQAGDTDRNNPKNFKN